MTCLTPEQLARVVLVLDEGVPQPAHVEACQACQAKLTELRAVVLDLRAAHATSEQTHVSARARLLDQLSQDELPAARSTGWGWLRGGFRRPTSWQRVAMGGVGISTLLVAAVVLSVLNAGSSTSAMERMARELREVKSYTYRLSTETTMVEKDLRTAWREKGAAYWQAPDAFHDESKITKIEVPPGGQPCEELIEQFEGVYPAGKPGIFIDHKRRTFFWGPLLPVGSSTYPLEMLKIIREGSGKVLRDLGEKEVQGRKGRGYVVSMKTGEPPMVHDIHVWVDRATDLPLEFGYEVQSTPDDPRSTVLRITDFRWNQELDPKLFVPKAPADYREIESPPIEEPTSKPPS